MYNDIASVVCITCIINIVINFKQNKYVVIYITSIIKYDVTYTMLLWYDSMYSCYSKCYSFTYHIESKYSVILSYLNVLHVDSDRSECNNYNWSFYIELSGGRFYFTSK